MLCVYACAIQYMRVLCSVHLSLVKLEGGSHPFATGTLAACTQQCTPRYKLQETLHNDASTQQAIIKCSKMTGRPITIIQV